MANGGDQEEQGAKGAQGALPAMLKGIMWGIAIRVEAIAIRLEAIAMSGHRSKGP